MRMGIGRRRSLYAVTFLIAVLISAGYGSITYGVPFKLDNDPVLPTNPEMRIDNTNAQAGSISVGCASTKTFCDSYQPIFAPSISRVLFVQNQSNFIQMIGGPGTASACNEKLTINIEAGPVANILTSYRLDGLYASVGIAGPHESFSIPVNDAVGPFVRVAPAGPGITTGTYAISQGLCTNSSTVQISHLIFVPNGASIILVHTSPALPKEVDLFNIDGGAVSLRDERGLIGFLQRGYTMHIGVVGILNVTSTNSGLDSYLLETIIG